MIGYISVRLRNQLLHGRFDDGISLNSLNWINYSAILDYGDSVLYSDIEVTPEEVDEMIMKIAQNIHKSGFDVVAILVMETIKPLSFIGAQMGRFFISPFLPGDNIGISGEKLFQIFEKHDNVEKVIKAVEELVREEEEQKKIEKANKLEREITETGAVKKKGWRRFLPF